MKQLQQPLDPALGLALLPIASAGVVVAPLPTTLSVLVVTTSLWKRLSAVTALVWGLSFAVGAARAIDTVRGFQARHAEARQQLLLVGDDTSRARAVRRCALSGMVLSSPVPRDGTLRFVAQLEHAECEGASLPALKVVRLYGGPLGLERGDVFEAIADLGPARLFRNLELMDPWPRAARQGVVASGGLHSLAVVRKGVGIEASLDAARNFVRQRIEATFPESTVGMAKALVLGDSDLEPHEQEAFQKSGLAHLLAVSGSHLILAVLTLVRALRQIASRLSRWSARTDTSRWAFALGAVAAPLYADFAGGSGSAWRAAWMLAFALGARSVGRRASVTRAVCASCFGCWCSDALVLFDFSFLLSLAATAGLVRFAQLADCVGDSLPAARWVHQAALATLAASLPCLPVLLLLSEGTSLATVAGNMLAGPFGELLALPLCLSHAVAGFWPAAENGIALVASGALAALKHLAYLTAQAPYLFLRLPTPSSWHFCALVSGLGVWLRCHGQLGAPRRANGSTARHRVGGSTARRLAWMAVLLLGLTLAEAHSRSRGRSWPFAAGPLRVTALDVGQGDATLIDLPDGSLVLIDGGGFVQSPVDPGELVLLPVLRARRRHHLDLVIVTHPHPDHFTGLVRVLQGVRVEELWLSGQGRAHGAGPIYGELLAAARAQGTRVRSAKELCADQPGPLQVLAPCPDFDPALSANDNSLVVRLEHGRHSALFVGDAEHEAEQRLLQRYGDALRSTFLKVGHHGSRTSSSPEFIRRVAPQHASISCGMRNRFGHPHAAALQTLGDFGSNVLRIDDLGAAQWTTTGTRQSTLSFEDSRQWLSPLPQEAAN